MLDIVKRREEISHNVRVTRYPDGSCRVVVADRPIYLESGYERARKTDAPSAPEVAKEGDDRAKRRAKSAVRDLALSNRFGWFVTLTLDQSRIDRYDYTQVVQKLNRWMDNRVRRNGLRYVMVAERHKDGAIHFHALMSWDTLHVVDSGHKDKQGRVVYNLPAWDYGFTTAVRLDGEYRRVVAYLCKYITKSTDDGKVGGRWYYRGGRLAEPVIEVGDLDMEGDTFAELPGYALRPEGCRFALKIMEFNEKGELQT